MTLGYASEGLVVLSFVVCGVVERATSRASFRDNPAGVTVSPGVKRGGPACEPSSPVKTGARDPRQGTPVGVRVGRKLDIEPPG